MHVNSHNKTCAKTGYIQVAFLLYLAYQIINTTFGRQIYETDLLKNSRDMGSKPASWIEVKPLAIALLTVTAKRLSRSLSVKAGFLINSCALSINTPIMDNFSLDIGLSRC